MYVCIHIYTYSITLRIALKNLILYKLQTNLYISVMKTLLV